MVLLVIWKLDSVSTWIENCSCICTITDFIQEKSEGKLRGQGMRQFCVAALV